MYKPNICLFRTQKLVPSRLCIDRLYFPRIHIGDVEVVTLKVLRLTPLLV